MTRIAVVLTLLTSMPALADPAEVLDITARASGDTWRFDVTIAHPDTGWDDYANGWRVELEDGTILGTRILHHPHVNEQPFTRSLSGVEIPAGVDQVMIRASTNVEGWGDTTTVFPLPAAE